MGCTPSDRSVRLALSKNHLQTKLIDEPVLKGGLGETPQSSRTTLDFIRYPAITKSDFKHGWSLPGLGSARDDCGEVRHKGCLNRPKHPNGKIFLKAYRKSCSKASCPICFISWSMKESHRASHRIRSFKPDKYRAPIHVMFSPPEGAYTNIKELRKTMYALSKTVGLYGGLSVFHPYRCDVGEWYWSPHFHTIGYGWISGTKEVYEEKGWIVKNLGVRKDVVRVVNYQLSHAGIRSGQHTVTWFGELGYAKLKVEKEPEENNCPYCSAPLVLLQWEATDRGPPDDPEYEGLTDDSWSLKVSDWQLGRTGLDHDAYEALIIKNYQNMPISTVTDKALKLRKNLNQSGI